MTRHHAWVGLGRAADVWGWESQPDYQQLDQLLLMHRLQFIDAGLEVYQCRLGLVIDFVLAQGPFKEFFRGSHQECLQEFHEKLIVILCSSQPWVAKGVQCQGRDLISCPSSSYHSQDKLQIPSPSPLVGAAVVSPPTS